MFRRLIREFVGVNRDSEIESLRRQLAQRDEEILQLKAEIAELRAELEKFKRQASKNSGNSSKPPSTDGLAKAPPRSLRERSGRKPGAQKGHVGKGLSKVDTPDQVVVHAPNACSCCQASLASVEGHTVDERQVFDIPKPKVLVTEHRVEKKTCPDCGNETTAAFPNGVEQPTQYGLEVKATLSYLSVYQLLPSKRIVEICDDLLGLAISEGTVFNAVQLANEKLADFEQACKEELVKAKVLHVDETGIRVKGKLHWLHTASTQELTHYHLDERRGNEAMERAGILPDFKGTLVHDFWPAYAAYTQAKHGMCCAHLLRELNGVIEREKHAWAVQMKALLQGANKIVNASDKLSPFQRATLRSQYQRIVKRGHWESDGSQLPKKTPSRQLLNRFILHEDDILRFTEDPNVPFDNNLAERDIRMVKVKQKISGTFRSVDGAKHFARIRSYISTAKKNGHKILLAMENALLGCPFMPCQSQPLRLLTASCAIAPEPSLRAA